MNPISVIFNEILWRPLFNGLIFLYTKLPPYDMGVAIIALTLIIRLLLAPVLGKAKKSQQELASIQPEIKKIQEKYKNDKTEQSKALMELYQAHKVNPFSGCLMIIIQLPVLIALFSVFRTGFDAAQLHYLYSFIPHPQILNPISFGVLNLSKGNIYLGVIAAITQYFNTKLMGVIVDGGTSENEFTKAMRWQSLYVFPALIFVWSYTLPSALTLYWTILNIFGIIQELATQRKI